jgi:hypothetical protein
MQNEPTQEDLAKLPPYRSADNTAPVDIIIHMHFFLFNWHWYIATYEPTHRVFFGYANLGDDGCAEWGSIPLQELEELSARGYEVERDVHWKPVRFGETLEGQKYQRRLA